MIGTLIKSYLAPYELYIWAGLAVLSLGGIVYETHVQREIGRNEVRVQVQKATEAQKEKDAKETARLQALADKAEADRDAVQKKLDNFDVAHPVGSVWLCGPPVSANARPAASAKKSADADTRPGPAVVSSVPAVDSPPRDIGPDLEVIVSAASKMAGLYREFQQQPVIVNASPQRR
jgi:hypothetical protein